MAAPSLPDPSLVIPNIGSIAGPVLLGTCLNWALYGVLGMQAYLYYLSFPRDQLVIKALVFFWTVVETFQTIVVMHDTFNAYGNHFGSVATLNEVQLNWLSVPVLTGIVSCSVQLFFCYRIWVLSNNRVISAGIAIIALTQACAALVSGVQAERVKTFTGLQSGAFVSTTIWLAGSAACDVLIALMLTISLLQQNANFHATKLLVRKIVRLTIETGTLTATIAVLDVCLFLALPKTSYHTVPALTLGKLYSNTALATLNSRAKIAGGRDAVMEASDSMVLSTRHSAHPRQGPLNVNLTTSVITDAHHIDESSMDKAQFTDASTMA